MTRDDYCEGEQRAWDDITCIDLDTEKVQRARMVKICCAKKKNVWTQSPRLEALIRGWKIIKTRWIDFNKGDIDNSTISTRLVVKEFKTGDADALVAGTPSLDTLKQLLNEVATVDNATRRKVLMINGMSRVFSEAAMQKDLCIELPKDDTGDEDKTRDDIVRYENQSLLALEMRRLISITR